MSFFRGIGNFITFGAIDRLEAKSITTNAKNKEEKARNELEIERTKTNSSLESLGLAKQRAFSSSLQQFVSLYQVVGKVDLSPLKKPENGIDYPKFKLEYAEIKEISTSLCELAVLSGGGIAVGAAAVGGAMGLAVLVGTASTGTAIGTLSGVAATNATLAWLGGGAISAGGAGMVGGMVVLGGIAIAPLAVFGMFLGVNKGKQKLNAAQNYSDEVDIIVEKVSTLIMELQKIQKGAKIFEKTICSLEQLMMFQNQQMQAIVDRLSTRGAVYKYLVDPVKKIFNIQILTNREATIFRDTVNCASLLKQITDTPLMTGEGAFMEEALKFLEQRRNSCNALLNQANMPSLTVELKNESILV